MGIEKQTSDAEEQEQRIQQYRELIEAQKKKKEKSNRRDGEQLSLFFYPKARKEGEPDGINQKTKNVYRGISD